MKSARSIAIAVLGVLAVVVVCQNLATTKARFLFFSIEAPLAGLLAAQVLIGVGLGLLIAWRRSGAKT